MNKKFLCLVKLVIGLSFVVGASATALGEEFYKGKTILFIVGVPPGGGYDTYTRAVARHIGKYITDSRLRSCSALWASGHPKSG